MLDDADWWAMENASWVQKFMDETGPVKWINANGEKHAPRDMDDDYLLNLERFLRGDGMRPIAPRFYGTTRHVRTLEAVRAEIAIRGLLIHPAVSQPSCELCGIRHRPTEICPRDPV